MKIENYGTGERCREVMRRLSDMDGRGELPHGVERIILLPIPTARDGVHITGSCRLLSEVLFLVGEGDAVVGYGIPEEEKKRIISHGGAVIDVSEDGEFMAENARISAIGAVGYILSSLKRVPSDLSFGIVGYGRIGSHLLRYLLFLGGKIVVFTSKDATRVELGACGVETRHTDYRTPLDLSEVDVLINTAPTDISSSFCSGVRDGLTVIELASGNNLGELCTAVRLMSIPDRYYPISAGAAYCRAIQKHLCEVNFK